MKEKIFGILILVFFYGIYFTKMWLQKQKGIRTHQIGSRKEKGLHLVETLMSIATLIIVPIQLISIFSSWSLLPEWVRITGFILGMLGDLAFLIAVISMKDSWRAGIPEEDKTKLVSDGIYKWSRNPAFLGFDLMYMGVCLLFCNWLSVMGSAFAIIMLHMQILQEESYMEKTFGEEYRKYKQQVGRYLGRHAE